MKADHPVDPPKNWRCRKSVPGNLQTRRENKTPRALIRVPPPIETSNTPTKINSKKKLKCPQYSSKHRYRSTECVMKHKIFAHPSGKSEPEKVSYMDATKIPIDHMCPELPFKSCLTLYKYKIGDKSIPKERSTPLIDNQFKMYDAISNFRRGISSRKCPNKI